MTKRQKRKNKIIVIAIIFSIILYVAGVLTGLISNQIFTKQISGDIQQIKSELDNSALDIKNIQLKQQYLDNFEPDDKCKFMSIYNDHQLNLIKNFWSTLPKRLENYENNNELSEDYIAVKREYIRFSLRYWLTLTKYNEECDNKEIIPVLYFYTKDCSKCLEQAKEFDIFKEALKKENKTLLVFPIDANFEEDMVTILKKNYEIDSVPSTIIKKQVIIGQVINAKELEIAIEI